MAHYLLRYFFDAGSGVCLWSANDAAREEFDYPVQLQRLELPENLLLEALHVVTWFDTSLDWSYPPNPSPWSEQERAGFNEAAQVLLSKLRQQLGPAFDIRDESGTMPDGLINSETH